jgi:hypothetical protein
VQLLYRNASSYLERSRRELMYMVYKMNARELDSRFLKALKAMFKDKDIEIVVSEAAQTEEDETAYLLSTVRQN